MPYATVSDVQKLLPQVQITTTTKPPQADVTTWIDEGAKELDLLLRNLGYATPVSDANDLITVRDMLVHKVGARVLRARIYGIGPVDQSGAKELERFYELRVQWLSDPKHPFELANTARTTNELVKPSGMVRGFVAENADVTAADDAASEARVTMAKVF